jgi:hypothetical protein
MKFRKAVPMGSGVLRFFHSQFNVMVLGLGFCISVHSPQEHKLQLDTGNDVLSACTDENYYYKTPCQSYIDGVVSGYQLATQGFSLTPVEGKMCIPIGVKRGQGYDVVVKFLEDHPETRQENSAVVIVNALMERWRCKQK